MFDHNNPAHLEAVLRTSIAEGQPRRWAGRAVARRGVAVGCFPGRGCGRAGIARGAGEPHSWEIGIVFGGEGGYSGRAVQREGQPQLTLGSVWRLAWLDTVLGWRWARLDAGRPHAARSRPRPAPAPPAAAAPGAR